jgi:SAM-dependent methyltransferase
MKVLNVGSGNTKIGTDRIDNYSYPNVTKVHDIENGLPYKSNTFDVVYSRCVYEHMKDPFKLLLEMKRVCKPGGKIVLITDNAGYLLFHHNPFGWVHGNYNYENPADIHYALFTEEHLRNHFKAAGLGGVKQHYDYIYKWGEHWKYYVQAFVHLLFRDRLGAPRLCIEGVKK